MDCEYHYSLVIQELASMIKLPVKLDLRQKIVPQQLKKLKMSVSPKILMTYEWNEIIFDKLQLAVILQWCSHPTSQSLFGLAGTILEILCLNIFALIVSFQTPNKS